MEPSTRKRGRPRAFFDDAEGKIVQAVDKALAVLKIVAEGGGLSLSEIAERAKLPAPTVYRSLVTMQVHGLVSFHETAQLWRIDVEAFRIGSAFLSNTGIVEQARPVMQALMAETGETANLGIIAGGEVVFLSQVETHEPIRAFFRPGTRGAIHSSGIGKALFSFRRRKEAEKLAATLSLAAHTDRTATSIEQLLAMREDALRQGYAVDDEERTLGMRCIAAPVFNNFGEAVAAISVSGPSVRMSGEKLPDLGRDVRGAADEITRNIGGRAGTFSD